MSGASEVGTMPAFLQSAAEYREHLQAELAKVDEFLRAAAGRSASAAPESPDFLLGGHEMLDALGARGLVH